MNIPNKGYKREVTCLKGKLQSSRGQRPRSASGSEFCPVRATQNSPFLRRYAAIIARAERAHHFLNQTSTTLVDERNKTSSLGLPFPNSSNFGLHFDNNWRRGRPCAYSLQSFEETRADESAGIAQEGFIEVHKDPWTRSCTLSLAGRIRPFRHQSFPFSCRSRIHIEPGDASQETNLSRRASGRSQKIRSGIRRMLPLGLRRAWIALSGQNDSPVLWPRALPSAGMVQAFGLISCYFGGSPTHDRPRPVALRLGSRPVVPFRICRP